MEREEDRLNHALRSMRLNEEADPPSRRLRDEGTEQPSIPNGLAERVAWQSSPERRHAASVALLGGVVLIAISLMGVVDALTRDTHSDTRWLLPGIAVAAICLGGPGLWLYYQARRQAFYDSEKLRRLLKEPKIEYSPFWWSAEWRHVIPDTVLAHLRFRLDGKTSCERKARVQGVALIVVSSLVPVAAAAQTPRWTIALLGSIATILAGVGQLFGWRENVVRENRSLMQIQQQLVFWKSGQAPYKMVKTKPVLGNNWEVDNNRLLRRVEQIVQTEGEGWAMSVEKDRGEAAEKSSNEAPDEDN